jgi:thioesterase domain-containing protein
VIEVPAEGEFDEAAAEQADLIGIQLGGGRPPLLMIRTWHGEIAHERALARALGPEQPILSVGPPRGTRVEDLPADVHAWAELAFARLTAFPLGDPVLIGGWSFGGVIAYEVAQRLAAAGRRVALVALLDTRVPSQRPVRRRGRTRRGAFHKSVRNLDRLLEQRGWRARLAYLGGRARRRREKLAARAERVGEWWRSDAPAELRAPSEPESGDATFVTPTGKRIPLLKRTIWVCYRKYRKTPSRLPALVLRTAESQEASQDAALGWGPALLGDFECTLVPGEHFTMFDPPHLAVFAERLADALARAAKQPRP